MITRTLKVERGSGDIEVIFNLAQAHNSHIAGGYAAWMCTPIVQWKPGDVDIFPVDCAAIPGLLQGLKQLGYTIFYESENAYSLKYEDWIDSDNPFHLEDIQVVKPLEGDDFTPVGLLKYFDLTVCCAVLTAPDTCLVHIDFESHMRQKLLEFNRINNPIAATMRLLKYSRKGGTVAPSTVAWLFEKFMEAPKDVRERQIVLMLEDELTQEDFDDMEAGYRDDWYDDDY